MNSIPVEPGRTYEFGYWYRTSSDFDGVTNNTKMRLGGPDGGLIDSKSYSGNTTEWKKVTRTRKIKSEDIYSLKISIVSAGSKGWIDFSEVYLIDITRYTETESSAKKYTDSQIKLSEDGISLGYKNYTDGKIKDVEEQNKKTVTELEKSITQAKTSADSANQSIADMAKDTILSPLEKPSLAKEWETIQSEYPKLKAQAKKYGVSDTKLDAKYFSLKEYITPLLKEMDKDSTIKPTSFKQTFKEYYDEKLDVMNLINDRIKELGDIAVGEAYEYVDSQIDMTKEGIVLGYKNYTDEKIDSQKAGGRNLLLGTKKLWASKEKKEIKFPSYATLVPGTYVLSADIEIVNAHPKPGSHNSRLGLEFKVAYESEKAEWLHSFYYPKEGENYKGRIHSIIEIKDTITWIGQKGLFANQIEGDIVRVGLPKLERGNVPTDWSPAPEDLIEEATNESKKYTDSQIKLSEDGISLGYKNYTDGKIKGVEERNKKTVTELEKSITQAKTSADSANKSIADMAKDTILSPIEKTSLAKEWEAIQSEYPKLKAQAKKYEVSDKKLNAKYSSLKEYITPLLKEVDKDSTIKPTSFKQVFKDYYDEKLDIMNLINDRIKELGDIAVGEAYEYVDSQIDITKDGIKLGYKQYSDDSIERLDINDSNLIVANNLKAHPYFTTTPKVEKGGRKVWVKWKTHPGNLIAINVGGFRPEGLYTLSARIEINGKPVTSNRFPSKKIYTGHQDSQNKRFDISDDGRLIATEQFNGNDNGCIFHTYMNDMNEGDIVTFYDFKFQKGNKATDWTPAPEDLVEEATNESKKYTDNQISITEEGIKSKVDKDGVISQINQSSEGVLIDGAKHHITGKTKIDNAVITSAMIKDIDASRVTVSANSGKKSVRMTKDGFVGYDSSGKLRLLIGVQDLAGDGQSDPSNVVFYSGNGKKSVSVGTNVDDTFVIGSETSGVTGLVRIPKQLTLESDDVIVMGGTNKSDYGDYWRFGTSTVGGTKHVVMTTDRPYAGVLGHSNRFLRKIYTTDADIRRLDVGYGFNNPQEGDFSVRKDSRSGFIMSKVTTTTRTYDVPANVRITRNGVFGKAISASKYKLNIQNLKQEEALDLGNRLLTLNPSKWWSKDETEGYVSELDGDDDFVDENNVSPYYGMVAEDLRDVGLDPYIEYDEKTGEIEGIQYDRLWTPLIPIIREQRAEIEKLKIEVEKLKRGGDA